MDTTETCRLTGDFALTTEKYKTWLKLGGGKIIDCAFCMREYRYKSLYKLIGPLERRGISYMLEQIEHD